MTAIELAYAEITELARTYEAAYRLRCPDTGKKHWYIGLDGWVGSDEHLAILAKRGFDEDTYEEAYQTLDFMVAYRHLNEVYKITRGNKVNSWDVLLKAGFTHSDLETIERSVEFLGVLEKLMPEEVHFVKMADKFGVSI